MTRGSFEKIVSFTEIFRRTKSDRKFYWFPTLYLLRFGLLGIVFNVSHMFRVHFWCVFDGISDHIQYCCTSIVTFLKNSHCKCRFCHYNVKSRTQNYSIECYFRTFLFNLTHLHSNLYVTVCFCDNQAL